MSLEFLEVVEFTAHRSCILFAAHKVSHEDLVLLRLGRWGVEQNQGEVKHGGHFGDVAWPRMEAPEQRGGGRASWEVSKAKGYF